MSTTITTAQGLQDINSFRSGSYVLGNDIDMTGFSWTPIGLTSAFSGSFDGAGYTISNLSVTDSGSFVRCALFAESNATASFADVTLEDFILVGNNYVGALIGYCNGSSVTGMSITGQSMRQYVGTSNFNFIGGLIGKANNTTYLNDCEATVTMSYTSSSNSHFGGDIGGLVGSYVSGSWANCSVDINIDLSAAGTGCAYTGVGGLFGSFYGNSLQRCTSSGRIIFTNTDSSVSAAFGGLGGFCSVVSDPYIRDCYSEVTIDSNSFNSSGLSGFIGYFNGSAGT